MAKKPTTETPDAPERNRAAQDATLINIRALRKDLEELAAKVSAIETKLAQLSA